MFGLRSARLRGPASPALLAIALAHAAGCGGNSSSPSSGAVFPVVSVNVSIGSSRLAVGETVVAVASLRDVRGVLATDRQVAWSSSDAAVATVNATGLVTAVAPGTVSITATSEGKSGAASLTVTPSPTSVPVETVSVSLSPAAAGVGASVQATAITRDANGNVLAGRPVSWSSSDATVATVDVTGLVTALAAGTVSVTATSEGKSGSATLTVNPIQGPVPVETVSVALSPASVGVGASARATAITADGNGNVLVGRTVTWTSGDPEVATVDAAGLVVALAPGTAIITATSEGKSGSATLTVSPFPVATVSVTLSPASVMVGQTAQSTAVTRDAGGNALAGRTVTWASSNLAVAVVNASGLVTALTAGTASITATSEGQSGSATLTVTPVPVATVAVSVMPAGAMVGQTAQATASTRDAGGSVLTGRAVSWASSDVAVATVDATGLVTALAPGTVTITATSEGKSGSATLTVTPVPVATVAASVSPASVMVGQTAQATASTRDAGGNVLTGRAVSWASADLAAATVSATGLVTGLAPGTVTITATSEGKSGSTSLTVTPIPVATVAVSVSPASVMVGQTAQSTATTRDANGNVLTGRPVTWGSSNVGVATVNATGLVTGLAPGTVTITATSEGKSGSTSLTVTPIPVATVSVSLSPASVIVGQTAQATATTRDANGNVLSGRTVTWASSNAAVARVSAAGLVTALGAGTASITATSEGKSGSATLAVAPIPVATVSVSVSPATVGVGDPAQATAVTRDANGNVLTGRTVAWSSSQGDIAWVDAAGGIETLGIGSSTITGVSEGRSGSATLTVTRQPVNSVLVALDSVRINPGAVTHASATTLDRYGNVLGGRSVSWGSSNAAVARVSGSGTVTAIAPGYASITATSEGITGSGTLTVVAPGSTARTILVIGPHPDDEALIAAGRARTAVNVGDHVKLVVVTNGDQYGLSAGLTRQGESVAAASVLGVGEQDVIFLGYPDTILNNIYTAGSDGQVFTGRAGVSATYGNRGLGGMDYHRYLTGAAGPYSRGTMRQDFEALIRNYQPDEIYTVTSYDDHPDHHAVALFVEDALASLRGAGAIPAVELFQTIVWVPGSTQWPQVDASGFTPTIPFQEPATLSSRTPLQWSDIYRFAVPPEMLSTDPSTSMKYQCIEQFQSQLSSWLTSFARADEFFWLTSY